MRYCLILPRNMLRSYSFSCLILVSVLVLIKLASEKIGLVLQTTFAVRIAFVILFLFKNVLTSFYAGFCAFDTYIRYYDVQVTRLERKGKELKEAVSREDRAGWDKKPRSQARVLNVGRVCASV